MKITLLDFIRNGNFGPITLGSSRHEVEKCFGAPPDWNASAKTPASAMIWKYGDVEFYFNERGKPDQLNMIFMDDFEIPHGEGALDLDASPFHGRMTLEEAIQILKDAGIAYEITNIIDGLQIVPQNAPRLTFDEENQILRSIYLKS